MPAKPSTQYRQDAARAYERSRRENQLATRDFLGRLKTLPPPNRDFLGRPVATPAAQAPAPTQTAPNNVGGGPLPTVAQSLPAAPRKKSTAVTLADRLRALGPEAEKLGTHILTDANAREEARRQQLFTGLQSLGRNVRLATLFSPYGGYAQR